MSDSRDPEAVIEFREASVEAPTATGTATILQPTTLTLAERRISVIGANGSGKSTLARLINGLVEPSGGSVVISGVAETARSLDTRTNGAAVRRAVGFVFTDPAAQLIMPTVVEDVALSLRRLHKKTQDRRAAAYAELERYGLSELADRSVHTLSGGQKQLLAIASVLATDPAILVADEPTTLLDLRNSRTIGDLLLGLPQQLILLSHDLELAARCERAIWLDSGRIRADGPAPEVVSRYRSEA